MTLTWSFDHKRAQADIRALNFAALHEAGYKGAVLDKDNCLTLPHRDGVIPELNVCAAHLLALTNLIIGQTAWKELKHVFGPCNSLVVSNSAGTSHDSGGLAAESVSHHLGVPVLRHSSLKPSRQTIIAIQRYFNSLPSPISDTRQLIVIGDRALTDMVLANRMSAFGILVTRDWSETFKTYMIGSVEHAAIGLAHRRYPPLQKSKFTKAVRESKDNVKLGYGGSTWTWTARALGWGSNSGKDNSF